MAYRKTAVTPLLMHWSYCSLALNHWYYVLSEFASKVKQYPFEQGKSEGFDSCDQPSNLTQIGLKWSIFCPGDLEIWWMTLKNNKACLLYYTGWPRSGWPQVGHFDQKIKVNQIASYCAMLYPRCCSLWPCTFWGLHSSAFDSSAGQTRGSHFNFYWGTDTTMWVMYMFYVLVLPKLTFITYCGIGKSKDL